MHVGCIQSIHRYPVKSMAGEDLEQAHVAMDGLEGDRAFAIRDEGAGEIRGGKRLPKLMMLAARYDDADLSRATVTFPDGTSLTTSDPALAARLSAWLGGDVTVWPRMPASNREHYRRVQPGASIAGVLARSKGLRKFVAQLATVGPGGRELRDDFGRLAGEPSPDLSVFPPELFEFVSPPGTYFDAYPIHIVTDASLAALRAHEPDADWDARRFRANLIVETSPKLTGLAESTWEGRLITVGEVQLACTVRTPRCSMVTQPQPGLEKDARVLRTIVREAEQCVGIYARVVRAGRLARGAEVTLP